MKTNTINFEGKDYTIKQSFRALMMFEEMAGKQASEANDSVTDLLKMFYAILKSSNMDTFNYSFDAFIEMIDSNINAVSEFTEFLTNSQPKEIKKKVVRKA